MVFLGYLVLESVFFKNYKMSWVTFPLLKAGTVCVKQGLFVVCSFDRNFNSILRERIHVQAGEGQRKRENVKQAPCC